MALPPPGSEIEREVTASLIKELTPGRRFEFGKIGKFDRVCSPRALVALVWRDGGGLVYFAVRVPWYSRRGFRLIENGWQDYPPGWCRRFLCLRIRWRWPTFKRSSWLEPR